MVAEPYFISFSMNSLNLFLSFLYLAAAAGSYVSGNYSKIPLIWLLII